MKLNEPGRPNCRQLVKHLVLDLYIVWWYSLDSVKHEMFDSARHEVSDFGGVRPSPTQTDLYLTVLDVRCQTLEVSDLHPLKLTIVWQCQTFTRSNLPLFNSVRPSSIQTDHHLTVSDLHPLKLTIVWQSQTFTNSKSPLFDSVRLSPTLTDCYLTVSDLHPLKPITI